jgi:uncharacterized RDD family membrane protein YckC
MEKDTIIFAETPEGIELALHTAGPVIRFLAYAIDFFFRFIFYMIVMAVLNFIQIFGMWLYFIILFIGEWFYFVFFEVLNNGKSPGKALLGIKVIMQNGAPIGWNASILRNLLRAADIFLYVIYVFGLLSMMYTKGFKRLGDLAAGSVVVYSRDRYYLFLPDKHFLPDNIKPVPPPVALTADEKNAIIRFTSRLDTLGKSRAEELAHIIGDQLKTNDADSLHSIIAVAAWICGNNKK